MATRYLLIILLAWAGIGLVVAFVMRRRGHDFFLWFALGAVLGPLIIPVAIERVRFHEVAERDTGRIPTPAHRGFDVLAGLDGSRESAVALDAAMDLFRDSITSLTIATVLDYDSESAVGGEEARGAAQAMLERASSSIDLRSVKTTVLFGRADRALSEYARTHGIELIVVGPRGHGATEALFGSITRRLVGTCELPVFVGPSVTDSGRGQGIEAAIHTAQI